MGVKLGYQYILKSPPRCLISKVIQGQKERMVPGGGIEPPTRGFSVGISYNNACKSNIYIGLDLV